MKRNKDFSILEKKLGIFFKNKNLLVESFCHRSFLNEHPEFPYSHNERLEFLGDAVLELVVTEHLFKRFPEKTEGELTNLRAALVNTKRLFEISEKLGFKNFLLLSKGEEKGNEKGKMTILANTFEALIGAIYLDQGLEKCREFLEKELLIYLDEILEKELYLDPKTKLQEEVQAKLKLTPVYKVLKEWGPDHRKKFLIGVFFGEKMIATGEGFSKQEAEEEAAKRALEIYFNIKKC